MEEENIIRLSRDPSTGQFFALLGGDRVSLALEPSDVHDPTELPTYLAGYRPFGFRADEASRIVLVDNDEDKYRQFSSDDAFRQVKVKGSTQGAVPEVDPQSTLSTYKVVERYIGSFIPVQTQRNAGGNPNYDPRMAAGRRCMRALELDREIDVFTLLGTAGSWNSVVQTAVSTAWDSTGDAIKDLQTAIEKSFQPVTEVWMNQKVAHAFLRNTSVRDHMRQMMGDSAASGAVLSVASAGSTNVDFVIPGLPPVRVVASRKKNETTAALEYTLPNVAVLVTTVPGSQPTSGDEIQSTATFRRRGPSGVGVETREFFVENRGPLGGTMIVCSVADIPIMTSNLAGGILTGVHS